MTALAVDAAGVALDIDARLGFCLGCGKRADVLVRADPDADCQGPWEFCNNCNPRRIHLRAVEAERDALRARLDIERSDNARLRSTLLDIADYCDDGDALVEAAAISNTARRAASVSVAGLA